MRSGAPTRVLAIGAPVNAGAGRRTPLQRMPGMGLRMSGSFVAAVEQPRIRQSPDVRTVARKLEQGWQVRKEGKHASQARIGLRDTRAGRARWPSVLEPRPRDDMFRRSNRMREVAWTTDPIRRTSAPPWLTAAPTRRWVFR
jgi:hypothetical protein